MSERPAVKDLQDIWLFTYSRSSFLYCAEFLAELDKVEPESRQSRALVEAAIIAYVRPFSTCYLPPERKKVVPLKGVLPPQHLAEFHQHAIDLRNTMIGHSDATPAKGYTETPNIVVVGNFPGRFRLTSKMIGGIYPLLRNALAELYEHFKKHCDGNLSRLRNLYRSEFDKHPPGEYELVISEPPADWLIPYRPKDGDDFRAPG